MQEEGRDVCCERQVVIRREDEANDVYLLLLETGIPPTIRSIIPEIMGANMGAFREDATSEQQSERQMIATSNNFIS